MNSMLLGYAFPDFQKIGNMALTPPTKSGGPLCPSCSNPFTLGQRAMLAVSMVEEGRTDFVAVHEVCY